MVSKNTKAPSRQSNDYSNISGFSWCWTVPADTISALKVNLLTITINYVVDLSRIQKITPIMKKTPTFFISPKTIQGKIK